jgi:hypothetical protein
VTIQVKDGTFTGAVTLKTFIGAGRIIIQGNSGTPANVEVSTTSATCFTANQILGTYRIKDMKLTTTTGGICLYVINNAIVEISNLNFGASAQQHIYCESAVVSIIGDYAISGDASVHFLVTARGYIQTNSRTVTLTGTPAITIFAQTVGCSLLLAESMTFSGSATGSRYYAETNSAIKTAGGGANYFPGNSAGSTASGGQYV